MKTGLVWVCALIIGAAIGVLSALFMAGLLSGGARVGGAVTVSGWTSDWSIGSEAADPYVRARIARHGLLALRREEAVYFTRSKDDDGQPLQARCAYLVSGGDMPSEWWSITLYDSASQLPMNEDDRLSFDQTDAAKVFADGENWSFQVQSQTPENAGQSWVSSRGADAFDLMLRLYRPSATMLDSPDTVLAPPRITRLSCDGGER